MENCELAQRHERPAERPVCCRPCAHRRRASATDKEQRSEAWLIGEHRVFGEKKYCLANLHAGMDLCSLAATIKARWICE